MPRNKMLLLILGAIGGGIVGAFAVRTNFHTPETRVHLGRNWAAEVRIAEGHELVKSGPYRWMRHPVYTAMLGMFVATTIATGQLHSVLATILMAVLYQRKIRLEENILRETFGPQFDDYRRHTITLY